MARFISVLVAAALVTGCVGHDFNEVARTPSHALPPTETVDSKVGSIVAPLLAGHPGQSAFYFQNDGVDALATRVLMSGRAEYSIDVQYYLFSPDSTSRVFVGALLEAADRGVRVRLLLDDILTGGYDQWLAALDSHPHFEVRLFNPFLHRQARWLDGLLSFPRVNRRMHNKSFVVDNRFTIIGGRNIGAEYFAAHEDMNFGDMDVIGFGPVVQDVSSMFDLYWNDELAVPVTAVIDRPEDPEAAIRGIRERIAQAYADIEATEFGTALSATIQDLFDVTSDEFYWADYEVVFDQPELGRTDAQAESAGTIVFKLAESIESATEEVIIVSPYFVPKRPFMELLGEMVERGVRVRVLTNSLASTNHHVVHSGYSPTRKTLLKAGVELWELKPNFVLVGTEDAGTAEAASGLHTKAFVVDRKEFYLGSFNFDPRSAFINTELGVIVKSPAVGELMADRADGLFPGIAYRVTLTEGGSLAWTDESGEEPVVYSKEPMTSWGTRAKVRLMGILPIKGQL